MKFLRILGVALIAVIVLIAVVVGVAYVTVGGQMEEVHAVSVEPVEVPTDDASLERGGHVARAIAGCTGCHGENLAGRVMGDSPVFARFMAPNLTSGRGSAVEGYTVEDWVRAIRHGLDREGKPLILMPSRAYIHLADSDLGALLAYLRSVPPVDNELPQSTLNPMGRVVQMMAGPFLEARAMDHDIVAAAAPPSGDDPLELGRYLSHSCAVCHGEGMEGGMGPDLLKTGTLAGYDLRQFELTMRTGTTPAGVQMDTEQMPWQNFGRMTSEELEAVWTYLQSLPAGS